VAFIAYRGALHTLFTARLYVSTQVAASIIELFAALCVYSPVAHEYEFAHSAQPIHFAIRFTTHIRDDRTTHTIPHHM